MNEEKEKTVTTTPAPAPEAKTEAAEAPKPATAPAQPEAPKAEVKTEAPKEEAKPAPAPKAEEVKAEAPKADVKEEVKPEQKPEPKPEPKVEAKPAPAPAAPEAPKPTPQPATEPAPKPQVVPQPASEPAPKPTPVAQTAAPAAEAPKAEVKAEAPAPKEEAKPAPAPVAPAQAAPPATAPANDSIQAGPALNPLANETSKPAEEAKSEDSVVAPSTPLNTSFDTNIGFVAVGANLEKKKNKPLIFTIIIILLVGLAALGYFVIYPFVYKTYIFKPRSVYEGIVDKVAEKVNNKLDVLIHNKAIYDLDMQLETNVEDLKDLSGYTYNFNLGVDAENSRIQAGLKLLDAGNQEHSINVYVKNDRQYYKLSSFRDLIYVGSIEEQKPTWDKLYDYASKMNVDDFKYVVDLYVKSIKAGLLDNKFSKEDASITINGKTIKVLNSKYTIDNEAVVAMYDSINKAFANDDRALDLLTMIYKESGKTRDEIKKEFESFDPSKKILEDDEDYYFNIYTYTTKNKIVGFEFIYGESRYHFYMKDNYFEYRADIKGEDPETNKSIDKTVIATGVKQGNKTSIEATENDKKIAKIDISALDDNNLEFTYDILYKDKKTDQEHKLTGAVKLNLDSNDKRTRITFNASANEDDIYYRLTSTATEDWDSDVANINAGTAVNLTKGEIELKLNDFAKRLENTPIYDFFATVSGDFVGINYANRYLEDPMNAVCQNLNNVGYYSGPNVSCDNYMCTFYSGEKIKCN